MQLDAYEDVQGAYHNHGADKEQETGHLKRVLKKFVLNLWVEERKQRGDCGYSAFHNSFLGWSGSSEEVSQSN